jgi:hypothetical protein
MRGTFLIIACLIVTALALAPPAQAASQQDIQTAIDDGLDWLAQTQTAGGYWNDWNGAAGYVAATASAALAFIEEGHLPGTNYIDGNGTNHGDVVGDAVNYLYGYASTYGGSPAGSLYFRAANGDNNRSVYTTGLVTPVIHALGAANPAATITSANPLLNGRTYQNVMQGLVDWFTWGQNPDGGWRYYPNQGGSDNSTAQWGALPYLYGASWGIPTPAAVRTGDATTAGLEAWTNQVQNLSGTAATNHMYGGSGYSNTTLYVNMAKTGGLLLEFAVLGKPISDPDVQAALTFLQSTVGYDHWNDGPSGTWYGNLNHPYAMWAVYKGLEQYGLLVTHDNGTPGDPTDDFVIGTGISSAPGGITIGQDWSPLVSAVGDWYSHYCDYLVGIQNANGSWSGYSYWQGALATGWYINILNATGVPPRGEIPEPGTMALLGLGLLGTGILVRRRRRR